MDEEKKVDYYGNADYYQNDKYNSKYNDNNYEEKNNKKSIIWKIGLGLFVVALLIVLISVLGNKKTDEQKYIELRTSVCNAARIYVENNPNVKNGLKEGDNFSIKLKTLNESSLIGNKLENPYYSKTKVKYYSLDNSVRMTILLNNDYNCELIDNGIDITAPELRLSGDLELKLVVGTEYNEAGYSSTDDYDGDISKNVVVTGSVDTTKEGTYTLTYTSTDVAGNKSVKSRKVMVTTIGDSEVTEATDLDKTKPILYTKGDNPYCLLRGTKYIEPGAKATDNVDGNITDKISITNNVTGYTLGAFRVVYKVQDTAGNETVVYRAVVVTTKCGDEVAAPYVNEAPKLTLIGKSSITIIKGTDYVDLGATGFDKEDGDVTVDIQTDKTELDVNTVGIYQVIYKVTDSDKATTTLTRTVIVKDAAVKKQSVSFTTKKSNVTVLVGEGKDSLITSPNAVDENKNSATVIRTIQEYETRKEVSTINWFTVGKYKVTYTAIHKNGVIKQTKSIIVAINAANTPIEGSSNITVSKRNTNCDITQFDLESGGVKFTNVGNLAPVVMVTGPDRAACKTGKYEVTATSKVGDNEISKKINVNVVNGNGAIDATAPSKVIVNYNSAFPNDVYNKALKWVGGTTSGVTLGFTSTPKSGTSISYYEYSKDCDEVSGQASINGATTGTLTYTFNGKEAVCIRAVTTSGAKGEWSDPINMYVDKVGPTIKFTHTWDDETDSWHNDYSLTLTYQADDNSGSGLDHFEYTFDDVKGKTDNNLTTIDEGSGKLTIYENTESNRSKLYVYVRAVDKAGNTGEWVTNPSYVNIDTVKPNAPVLNVTGNSTSIVKIGTTFTDNVSTRPSGFAKLVYKIDNGNDLEEKTNTITMPSNTAPANVTKNVKVWAVDKAGNKSNSNAETNVIIAPAKVLATGVTLKNGSNTINNNAYCFTNTIYVGDSFTLTATPLPTNSDEKIVYWSSSDGSSAVINENGKVTIKKDANVTITAKIGSVTTKCQINSSYITVKASGSSSGSSSGSGSNSGSSSGSGSNSGSSSGSGSNSGSSSGGSSSNGGSNNVVGVQSAETYNGYRYLLYVPANVNSNTPVIVFLHGAGENGTNLNLVKKWGLPKAIESGYKPNAIVISPQCPSGSTFKTSGVARNVKGIIDTVVTKYKANSRKVSITGFSMGGYGVISMIKAYPTTFSSGVVVSGGVSSVSTTNYPKVPIKFFVGSSEGSNIENLRKMYNSLVSVNGASYYTFNVINGKNHSGMVGSNGYNIYTDSTYNVVNWMGSKIR